MLVWGVPVPAVLCQLYASPARPFPTSTQQGSEDIIGAWDKPSEIHVASYQVLVQRYHPRLHCCGTPAMATGEAFGMDRRLCPSQAGPTRPPLVWSLVFGTFSQDRSKGGSLVMSPDRRTVLCLRIDGQRCERQETDPV